MPNSDKSGRKHSKSCNRACSTAQKVVIPKGMINPEETTIIEIPCSLHKQPVVVAKRKAISSSASCGSENTGTRELGCKAPKDMDGSFNSFHSARQEDQFDFEPPKTLDVDKIIEDDTNAGQNFSPKFNSTALEEGQNDLASPDMSNMLEVDTSCGGQNSPRTRSRTSSVRSCPSPRRSSFTNRGGSCGTASANPMQELANTLQGDPNLTLDETEQQEKMQLQKDLEAFQKARRQLIERTTKFANQLPTGDVYDTFNSSYTSSSRRCTSAKSRNTMIDPRFDQKEYARQLYNTIL